MKVLKMNEEVEIKVILKNSEEVEAITNGDIKETKKRCYGVLEEIGAK